MARYLYSEFAELVNILFPEPNIHRKAVLGRIDALCAARMPEGTKLDVTTSHREKLVFTIPQHTIIATPSFLWGFNLRITGRNTDGRKGEIGFAFHNALKSEADSREVLIGPRGGIKVVASEGEPFGSDWVKGKIEENERGIRRN